MGIKILAIIVSAAVFSTVIELVRREKLTFKYAFGWMLISGVGLFFAIFDELLFKIAYALGFQLPSNFIFFILLVFFVFLSLFLTIFLCQQNNRNDTIAQKIGILEFEFQRLNQMVEEKDSVDKRPKTKDQRP